MKAPRITKRDALPEGLDFEALMKAGLNQARRFSGDTWTDFNVHDPGVTILEQLCFSLSDVAYRISHPIEDILETPLPQSVVRGLKGKVSPDTEPKRVEQNFPTGDRILTTAPVTEGDLRASICDCEPDIRNAWIADVDGQSDPEGGPVTGLFDVHLQLFSDVSADSISEERHQEIENAVRQRVGQLRLLATDVRDVKVLPSRRVTIHAEIEGEDDEAEHTHSSVLVARILHSLQMKLNPPAKFVNPDALRAAGIPLDEILDGPALSHGVVASGIAPRPTMNVSAQQTREWIRDVDGVKRIISLRLDPENEDEGVPFFDTSPGAIGCIRVHQNGNRAFDPLDMQGTDLQELRALDSNPRTRSQAPAAEGGPFESSIESVGASLKHRVELIHAEREKTRIGWTASDYKRVPRGRPRKTLGRYRSVQHTFPAIYGLTSNGGSIVQGVRAPSPDEIAQMRGFLALFEQQVANLLAQLENMPRLLSAHTVSHQTYFAGSLLAEGNDEDAPVGLDALLLIKGRPRRTAKMRRLYYLAVLRRAALAQDKDRLRVEAALDHLAARFNERFANGALRRFAGLRPTEAVAARTDRIKSKRDFVNSYAELSAYRASTASPRKSTSSDVGPDVFQGKEALAKKIKLLTGLANAPLIVEHVLLRGVSAFDPITQDNSNAALAVRFGAGSSKTLLLGERKRHKKRVRLEEYLLETTKRLRFEAATSDRVRLFFLGADNSVQAEILQPFSSVTQARAFAKNLKDVLQNTDSNQGSKKSLKKLECVSVLPNDFFKNRISVFFEFANINTLDPLFQGFVERTLKDNLPSHIAAECYWTEPSDLKPLKKKLDLFRSSLSQSASGDEQLSREICSDLSLRFHTKRTASWAT